MFAQAEDIDEAYCSKCKGHHRAKKIILLYVRLCGRAHVRPSTWRAIGGRPPDPPCGRHFSALGAGSRAPPS
jgi:hypothetical protein